MKFNYLYILVLIGLISCKKDIIKEDNLLFFKATNDTPGNIKLNKDFLYRVTLKNDSIKIYHKEHLVKDFIYKVDSKGIYIRIKDKYILLYSFQENFTLKRDKNLTNTFYQDVKLKGKKDYSLNGKNITIYHFIENGGSFDSYYMEGEGFICFYKYNDNDFIYLNTPKALEVSKTFLNDSTFFSKLILEKIDSKWKIDNASTN